MKPVRVLQLAVVFVCSCLLLVLFTSKAAYAQEGSSTAPVQLHAGAGDKIAAESATNHQVHLLPVRSKQAHSYSPFEKDQTVSTAAQHAAHPETGQTSASIPSVPSPGFYPDDLSFSGGEVLKTVQFNNIYVDCADSCWAHPAIFEQHLGPSEFIHVTDQYVGTKAGNRYTVGAASSINYPIFTTLADSDMLQIVHSAARTHGTGYDHLYHVFLPSGVDVCFTGTSVCYSPDNPSTFAFCAYHGSVTFSDIGHVLFSVEPYQAVNGCNVPQPSPNGELIDSTSNVLSHETIEAITDPDPPSGWTAMTGLIVFGAEIGDLCENATFQYGVVQLSGKAYEIQPEYSNTYHACATQP